MAAKKSAYLRSKIIKHVTNIAAYTAPSTLYLALYRTDPTINDVGTEVVGGSYARQAIDWGSEADGAVQSDAAISFPNMPTVDVTHWGIRDAASGGNLMYFGSFEIPIKVTAGSAFPIGSGDVSLAEL